MKCSVCGKEFGEGTNCQYCGVDRVTGLANYSGYDNHTGNGHHSSSDKTEYASNKITACYACGEIIPADSTYCPYCKKKLLTTCKKCGNTYSTQYSVCNKCGTDRYEYYQEMQAKEKEEKRRKLEEARKKHASEREESKLENEAYQLKNQLEEGLYQKKYYLIGAFGGFIGLIVGLQIIEKNDPGLIPALFVSFNLGFLAFWYPIRIYVHFKSKDNVEKWKEQHLNDPRRKYL